MSNGEFLNFLAEARSEESKEKKMKVALANIVDGLPAFQEAITTLNDNFSRDKGSQDAMTIEAFWKNLNKFAGSFYQTPSASTGAEEPEEAPEEEVPSEEPEGEEEAPAPEEDGEEVPAEPEDEEEEDEEEVVEDAVSLKDFIDRKLYESKYCVVATANGKAGEKITKAMSEEDAKSAADKLKSDMKLALPKFRWAKNIKVQKLED